MAFNTDFEVIMERLPLEKG